MTPEFITVLAIIALFSVIQSIFGMGVLIFGTPTLLLLEYDFTTTLSFLLPASFAISLLQVLGAGSTRVPVSQYLYLVCLPGIGVGFWLAGNSPSASWINFMVGIMLLFTALIRLWSPSRKLLSICLRKYLPAYHIVMGVTHGLTNLGGGLLAILASGTQSEKAAIRYTVAHYYLAFSIVQVLVLAIILGHFKILFTNSVTMIVSTSVYTLIGNKLFLRANNRSFNTALNIFIAIYGVALFLKV